ncbi:hypothetical protein, conserved [Babesia bigemina]|uniref:Uncharacterized protein n=1 Tax=Babesia bigemina TaxID=5866 RepID=A0A061DE54_BABBI|nr:hypothetical protein, conserved [Babesia bigemina]CDR96835.1 hypothetical protein, conserved [Babesia bigemina]|eukprot:XP_012769021.1 hypothetical protein, conserved [Babesia bigemina]
MRVPNASPCGIVTNFETRCSDHFHPSVLAYVLRNRAAHVARNSRGALPQRLRDELWQIGASAVSASSHLEPQTAATLLLSLAKLSVTLPDTIKALTSDFKFQRSHPKAIALTLNAFARHPRALQYVPGSFWAGVAEAVKRLDAQFSPQDAAGCALSITGLLAANRYRSADATGACNTPNGIDLIDRQSSQKLKATQAQVLSYAERMMRQLDMFAFQTRDLSCILRAVYASKVEAPSLIIATLSRLKEAIPTSLNGIDDAIYTLDLLPPPDFAADTVEKRRVKRDVARAEKAFVEWVFEYLEEHLDCLKDRELARLAAACNRLRSWSNDQFAIKFAQRWQETLRSMEVMPAKYLAHGVCYFLRRYEASVTRELANKGTEEQQRIAQVSDLCARVGEMLYDHAATHYSPEDLRRVEELVHVAEQCRAKRKSSQTIART